ncbi:MAG: phosphatase PAP2 family protein [Bacteroidaceae bacterium]|nr:phosphatase PAP2 family protein [Bacteroidaceae bacterium]
MNRFILLPLLVLVSFRLMAQDIVLTDSLTDTCAEEHKFKARQLIVPGALVAVGSVGVAFYDKLGDWGTGTHTKVDNYIQYAPVAANVFLGCLGVKHKHNFVDRVLISATAYAVEVALVNGLKYTVCEPRPGTDTKRNSFPSGHTATVFTGAELVRKEYGWGIGSAAYAIAVATGVLRVYNNRHWCNDVLAGAGIGILSANVAYWLYPLEKKLFTPKKKKGNAASMMVVPTYETGHHTIGLAFTAVL